MGDILARGTRSGRIGVLSLVLLCRPSVPGLTRVPRTTLGLVRSFDADSIKLSPRNGKAGELRDGMKDIRHVAPTELIEGDADSINMASLRDLILNIACRRDSGLAIPRQKRGGVWSLTPGHDFTRPCSRVRRGCWVRVFRLRFAPARSPAGLSAPLCGRIPEESRRVRGMG